jgi:hypothetical protein
MCNLIFYLCKLYLVDKKRLICWFTLVHHVYSSSFIKFDLIVYCLLNLNFLFCFKFYFIYFIIFVNSLLSFTLILFSNMICVF